MPKDVSTMTPQQRQNLADSKWVQFALFSAASMTVLGGTIIAASLPLLEKHFDFVPYIDMLSKFVLTLPALFVCFFAPISGFLLERYGRLKFIYPAILLWSVAGASAFLLEGNIYWILISRAIFGIATAFVMTGISALIGDYYQGVKRERALGLQGFFMAGGGSIFLMLGGFLSDIDWRYPFLVYLSGLPILFVAYFMLFEPPRGNTQDQSKSQSEYAGATNITDQKFHFWYFLPIYAFCFYAMSMFYIAPTQIPHFITQYLGKSGDLVGMSLAVNSICTAIISLFYPRLRQQFSIFKLYFISLMLIGTGFMLISVFHTYEIVLFSLALVGLGNGVILVNNSSWLLSVAKEYERARALGFLSASLFMGQFCSPLLTQPLVRFGGMEMMFGVNAAIVFVSALIFLFLKNPSKTF